MIAVIQRVNKAAVSVEGKISGECGNGLLILLGVKKGDSENDAEALSKKIEKLRIFRDDNDKMNFSVSDISGEMLVVSNFTLLANYSHGNRPEYFDAASPDEANRLYEYFVSLLRNDGFKVGTGVFGAHMEIAISADGPVTICMDSDVLAKKK